MAVTARGDSFPFGEHTSFGESVLRRRTRLGMTRATLAERVGCSPVTIKKIERDERRPSQQIAELLADHLLIPATERNRFVQMARGELAVSPLSASSLALPREEAIPLPGFFHLPERTPRSDGLPFVSREAELARLQTHLAQAIDGRGQVVFITGESGCGKSVLAQEFARRSQQSYPDLVVATGRCNAYTGTGDPYLPFREVLDLLTGDIEFQAVANELHPDHVRRLWQIMPVTLQALIEIGRDLFETLIPTRQLLNRLAGYIYAGASELAPFHQQIAALGDREGKATSEGNAQQDALFEQYSRVLLTVARAAPLLLILDDLQWADAGSINLLFHLARRLMVRPLLIVAIYRPADVAMGRDGGRHPLEPIVNELQHHFGNRAVELSQSDGRHFVDAVVDAQPNRLGANFREALFVQTGGHALFVVEMLRGLQEQGGVIQDEEGRWIEGAQLKWSTLPARVEGMIKERLGRLPPVLQEVLKIASVEGEIFTAEVVAGVRDIEPRALISQLSNVLDRQHDLIRVVGVRRLNHQGRTLSQYRFRHILFQRFLYESLDEVERVYLHQAVGRELEHLCAGQSDALALPLARHWLMAGDDARALAYFVTAGDVAAAGYAYTEAIAHYQQAVEIARRSEVASASAIHLYTRLGRILELNSQFAEALAAYEALHKLARARGDRTMELSAVTAQSTLYITLTPLHDAVRGKTLLEEALLLARAVGDQPTEAKILWNLATLQLYAGHALDGIRYGEESLALARALNLREQIAFTLNDLSLCYVSVSQFAQAKAASREASELWRELGNMPMLADCLSSACTVYLCAGEYAQVTALAQEAYDVSQAIHNLWGQAYSRTMVGLAYWELGAPDTAIEVMEEGIRLAGAAGFYVPHVFTRADLAFVFGTLGAVERGLELAQQAVAVAEQQVPLFRFYALTQLAQLHLWQGNLAAAEACIQRAKDKDLEKPPIFFIRTLVVEVEWAIEGGDHLHALRLLDEILPDLRNSGIGLFLAKAFYLRARALLGQGDRKAAQAALQEAETEAVKNGSRATLWPILLGLSELATEPGAAERYRREAQAIVEAIAERIPTPELRASFLALPQVRQLFSS